MQPLRNAHLAYFQESKEHEHRKERPSEVVHLIGYNRAFNRFRKSKQPMAKIRDKNRVEGVVNVNVPLILETQRKYCQVDSGQNKHQC